MGRASVLPSWRPPSLECICNQEEDIAMRLNISSFLPLIMFVAAVPMMGSCSTALKNDIQGAASGCDEFQAGGQAIATLDVDAKVKDFAQASSDLQVVGNTIKAAVKVACVNIAKDLGETDSWSADSSDGAISGACNAAAAKIDAIMTASIQAGASFALEVTGGQCSVDATAQASCEASCRADVTCTEATVEGRCPP